MHSPELIDQFIDLRIQGATLIEISEKLSVPKSTLHDWQKRHAEEIRLAHATIWEAGEKFAGLDCQADLLRLAIRLQRCEEELSRRSVSKMSNSELMRLTFATRREYFKRRDPLLKPLERLAPNRNLNLTPAPSSNGHPKPEKTGQKPEIHPNSRDGSHLPPHKNPEECRNPRLVPSGEASCGRSLGENNPSPLEPLISPQPPTNPLPQLAAAVHDSQTSSPTFTPVYPPTCPPVANTVDH